MMEFIQNFHFLRPWLLLFLLLPIALYLKKIKFSTVLSSWEDICDKNLLDFLLVNNHKFKTLSIRKFIYIGLIFATLAAAGPCWKKEEIPAFTIENPNIFVISLAQDMLLKDVPPSRLERAKFMLSDITDNLNDGQFGIEVYSNEPYIISPITNDSRLIKSLLPQIVPDIVPDQGDRLDRAIDLAIERFNSAGYSSGNIILFAADVGQRFDLALEKVKKAVQKNYHIYVVDTSYSGNEKLKLLAESGNGIYMSVQELSPNKLLQRINTVNNERLTLTENLRANYVDFGYYLIFIPLFCLLFLFRRGVLLLMLCCCAVQAQASFLQNNNQEGFSLFQKGEYEKAAAKFTDTTWKGISFYKQDKLEESLGEFSKHPDNTVSLYNKGVVLVKLCKYKEAFGVFDNVLKLNPNFADAAYNRQVLNDLFEKAKTDKTVLDCNNQQQNQQNSDQQENEENKSSSSDKQQESNPENQPDSQKQNSSEDTAPSENKNSEQQPSEQSQEDKQNSKENDSSSSAEKSDENPSDSQDTPAQANKENGDENNSQNKPDNENNGQEKQPSEQKVSAANAKKGDENQKYDEEALAMQRQYREIPEDTGGLLREFIKKEYMKGRYKNENM